MISARSPLPPWGKWSLFWTLFIGVGAVAGAGMMWFIPDITGMTGLLPPMQVLPFADVFFTSFVWPGIFLFVVNGVTQLTAATLIVRRHRRARLATLCCGIILMAWITIQFVIFETNPISIAYFLFGICEATMAVLWFARLPDRDNW